MRQIPQNFLSCYVIDRVISVYFYIGYNILLNFRKSIDQILFPIYEKRLISHEYCGPMNEVKMNMIYTKKNV